MVFFSQKACPPTQLLFEIMCYAMAITALWKLLDHACCMRHAVTVCTVFYGCVFIRMTSRTGEVVMLGLIRLK